MEEKETPKFSSSKKYQWEPTTPFLLSGEEFSIVLNSLRIILNSPEAQMILLAQRSHQVIENTLAKAVEAGLIKEFVEEKK